MIDPRLEYWTRGRARINFGDYLSEYFVERLLVSPFVSADRYRLIGSVIADYFLALDVRECGGGSDVRIVLWCCGMGDERPVDPALLDHCLILGVRGPLSRDALGLPADTPMGDPGFLVPLARPATGAESTGVIAIPHCQDPRPPAALLAECGADRILSPNVDGTQALEALLDTIASAEFVLAGSLHAAIVAAAYGRPFAFWDTGFIDKPFKWRDLAASLDVALPHVRSVEEGRRVHASVARALRLPRLSAILGCCPFAVRPSVWLAAAARDAAAGRGGPPCPALFMDRPNRVAELQQREHALRSTAGQAPDRADSMAAGAEVVAARLDETADWLRARARAARFRFTGAPAELTMAHGHAGTAFLGQGWSAPNEVAPWTVASSASMEFPHATGWHRGAALELSGYMFVPDREPFRGGRSIGVSLNDIPVLSEVVPAAQEGDTRFVTLTCPIPALLRARGGLLTLRLDVDMLRSPRELGVGEDERLLSFAPVHLRMVPEA